MNQEAIESPQLHLQLFDYTPAAPKLRTEMDAQGNVWFAAPDVCKILGLSNVTKSLTALDDDESTLTLSKGAMGEMREINFISESGLYHLIFKSRKDEAKQFRRWVTSEVLPQIRKTGKYTAEAPRSRPIAEADPRQKWGCKMDSDSILEFEGLPIRFTRQSGSVRFEAGDCCTALGYIKPSSPMQKLEDSHKLAEFLPDTMGRRIKKNTLALEGVLALAARSRCPNARKFHDFMRDHALSIVYEKTRGRQA